MRAVLLTIADAANADGEHAHPGTRAMVEGSLYSERSVQETVKKLIAQEWVEVEEEGGGRGRATVYKVIMKTPQPSQGLDQETPQKPRNPERETPQSSPSPPISTTYSTSTRVESTRVEGSLRGFDHFWAIYPRRNGRIIGKGLCEKRWMKLSLDDRRAAYRGARNYRADVDAGLTIAKDPDRWLRDRLWMDWQESPEDPPRGQATCNPADAIPYDPDRPEFDE